MSEYKFFLLHKVLVLSVNLLVLVAVTLAMYLAAQNPEEFVPVFLKVFGLALLPILSVGYVGKRLLWRHAQSI